MLRLDHPAWSETWPAPAKLNLLLHIVAKREDGYHQLETVFQLLEHGDSLRFAYRADGQISRVGGLSDVAPEDDLVIRAARLLFDASACSHGVSIELGKVLPAGGGLGGGSSDAATVLVVLNKLFELDFDVDRLAELGLKLGADVPLFVRGFSAWAEGVGENLTAIQLPEQWFVVATPAVAIGTAELFGNPDLCRSTPSIDPSQLDFSEAALPGRNDCQPVAESLYPTVAELRNLMSQTAPSRMTGTGSSVFSVLQTKAEADDLAAKLPDFVQKFVTKGLNTSVLQNKLQKLFSSK